MTAFVAILGLAFLILIHEAGHFFTALAVGMRPRRFYVGFPPALVKKNRNGVEYGVGAIPLGGYVKIPGMHRPAPSDLDVHLGPALDEAPRLSSAVERVKRQLENGDFEAARSALTQLEEAISATSLSASARRAANRGVNEIADGLGGDAYWRQRTWKKIAVIAAGPATNLVFAILLLAVVYMIGIPSEASRRVDSVEPNTPAARAGLQPGDTILAVNRVPTHTFAQVRDAIRESHGKALAIIVARRNNSSSENRKQISTPVGIVRTSSEAVQNGYRDYFAILALISLSLALLNLLPLLPLDGGHIAFSIIEGLRGKAVGRAVYERVSMLGIALILFIYVIGLSNDVGRLTGG